MSRFVSLPLVLFVLAASLATTATTPTPALAAEWTVDPARSRLGFAGAAAGAPFEGTFRRWDATIDFDPAHPEQARALVTIDMASAATGDRQKDQALPEADWFDIKSHPRAEFEATGFRPAGGSAYEAPGTLTIRGIRRPATLPFTLDLKDGTAHAVGRLGLVRTDFGVGQGEWTSPQFVALEVTVRFDLIATKRR